MSVAGASPEIFANRIERVKAVMADRGVDAVVLSVGNDLPYLTGYAAMASERPTLLVLRGDDDLGHLLVPELEAPRVIEQPGAFAIEAWREGGDPIADAATLLGDAATIAIGDQMWSRFLVDLLGHVGQRRFVQASEVIGALRIVKDAAEIAALEVAGAAADTVATALQAGEIALVGRTEADVSAELSRRLLDEGHDSVSFAIVAAGANAASPHHHPGDTVIGDGEIVLCDFGGPLNGYCSDITRCVHLGEPPAEIADAYAVLHEAQAAAVAAATVGTPAQDVDRAARQIIADAGFGEYFIHRTGHGIGLDGHEDPYIIEGNELPLIAGHAFSVEPGIYVPGKWGMRLEDIVVATDDGPRPMNRVDHQLVTIG